MSQLICTESGQRARSVSHLPDTVRFRVPGGAGHPLIQLNGRRGLAVAAATVTVAALSAAVPAPGLAGQEAGRASPQRVLVRAVPGRGPAAAAAVRAVGGRILRNLPIVDGVAASVPVDQLGPLSRSRWIAAVTPDAAVQLSDASYDGTAVASTYPETSGASAAWAGGTAGAGVTVAVLDTGVSPVPDLAGRVVAGPDFSGERNSTHDSFGHGTVMAGIVAGDGATSRGLPGGAYVGMAPKAKVLSVKVAGRNGATDVSTVLAALQWITSAAPAYGIRVVNLSWGTSSRQSAVVDPLDYAVERVWRSGVVVVVSAGNTGPVSGTIAKPGDDPMVITAGAYDDGHDTDLANDAVTTWSSRGPTVDGVNKPDLVAPGRTLVSTVDPHSLIAMQHPGALVGRGYIVGSGTSQAAAVTSGAVALLLSARPGLSPDQVKVALRTTAVRITDTPRSVQGRGRVALDRALLATPSSAVQTGRATGLGSLEASRGDRHLLTTCQGTSEPRAITGEMDALCRPWTADSWTADSWTADSWTADSWTADSWTADSWTADSWTADSWTSAFWGQQTPWWQPLPGERSMTRGVRRPG